MERYLVALKPIIPEGQYEQTKRTIEEFLSENGEGRKLHSLLHEFAQESDNWVSLTDFYVLCLI